MATVIVSDETVRTLIEAHASMAAWYYQMSEALRKAGAHVEAPSEAQRQAFVAQIAQHYPELSKVAAAIKSPRPYVPPPVIGAPTHVVENAGVSIPKPPEGHIATPERVPTSTPTPHVAPQAAPRAPAPPVAQEPVSDPPQSTGAPPPPPAFVDPKKVRYDE